MSLRIRKHLEDRGLQFSRYDVPYDDETATFKLYTPTAQLIGYQRYRPDADKTRKNDPKEGRYYTRVTSGYLPIWGFETLEYESSVVFLVEGIFKAIRLHRFNLPALALLGNNPIPCLSQINLLGRRKIAICDGDESGKPLAKFGNVAYYMKDKHLDDMTDLEAFEFLKQIVI